MSELPAILRYAFTVLVGQLAVMAFGVTDTVVAGHHSEEALAALSIGSAVFISVHVALIGLIQAWLPIWAELRGGNAPRQLGVSVRQSLYLCGAGTLLGMLVLMFPGPILDWAGTPGALREEVAQYLHILAWALPPALLFRIYTTLNQAMGHPQLVTWLQVVSLIFKIPLSVWLTFGGAGLPSLGVVGCAWATLIVNLAMLVIGLVMLRTQALYRPLELWRGLEGPDGAQIRAFARLGIPASMGIAVEVSSFTFMALFIARQGVAASASHQIASNLAAVAYMVPLSIAIACSARVGFWRGAQQETRAQRTVYQGLFAVVVAALCVAALLLALRTVLVPLYTAEPGVQALAALLLMWVACYQFADAFQTLCAFVLRCYRVTFLPLVTYCTLLWGVGLGGGYTMAYHGLGTFGPFPHPGTFWTFSTLALSSTATIFFLLLRGTLRRARQDALQAAS